MFSITVKIGHEDKQVKSVKDIAKVVKAPEKADPTHKFNAHAICILIGIIVTVICTFTTCDLVLHISGILISLPAFIQEGIDWIHDW